MTDVFSKEVRSAVMSRIRSKNTTSEILVRKELWRRGYRYRIHYSLQGKPDLVFIRERLAVFIDGCFWHKCPKCYIEPKSNRDYWIPKIQRNVDRDKSNTRLLKRKGWSVLRIWEHEVKSCLSVSVQRIETALKG